MDDHSIKTYSKSYPVSLLKRPGFFSVLITTVAPFKIGGERD
jgi:hypothetical protein